MTKLPVASHRTTLDDEVAGWLAPGGQHLQTNLTREPTDFGHGAMLRSQEHHLDRQAYGLIIRYHAAQDHDSARRPRCLGTAAQDRRGFTIGPVVEDLLQQIDVRAGRKLVEEALPDRRD